jgi:hypothetical protein
MGIVGRTECHEIGDDTFIGQNTVTFWLFFKLRNLTSKETILQKQILKLTHKKSLA